MRVSSSTCSTVLALSTMLSQRTRHSGVPSRLRKPSTVTPSARGISTVPRKTSPAVAFRRWTTMLGLAVVDSLPLGDVGGGGRGRTFHALELAEARRARK